MELLEIALKQSIYQCLQDKPDGASKQQNRKHISGLADAIELKLREESQTRAFISQFKIELNNLMGSRWINSDSNESEDENSGHFLSQVFEETDYTKLRGMIKLKSKHSGLYKINEQQDNKQSAECIMNSLETEVDDGYRSMNQCSLKKSIIHQLNEIKSRLIDLVHEIDEKVETRLSNVELDFYRRRRNILIEKLDLLLDTLSSRTSDTSQYSLLDWEPSQLNCRMLPIKEKELSISFNKQITSNYEEQEQIINYSDSSHSSLEDNSSVVRHTVEDGPIYNQPTINPFGDKPLNHNSLKKRPIKHSPVNNQKQHMPSSSTTSTYSTSSHTSSSSFL